MAVKHSSKLKRTFDETLKSARVGVPEAQYEVGLMYANGVGVAQDIAQAVHWVSQAAQRGMAAAQYLLATRFEAGVGVEQSVHQAALWFSKAVEQGHVKAQYRLGGLYARSHPEQARLFLVGAADAGLPQAQCALAQAFLQGDGVAVDARQAAYWYEAAATQGSAEAQHALGELLMQGVLSAPDADAALRWFRKAARQDHLASQVAIEMMERDGHTIASLRGSGGRNATSGERRRKEGRWIQAAEGGNTDARYQLGVMYERGLGIDADTSAAMHWYRQAAQQGHAKAQLALARLSEAAELPDAFKWYRSAAQVGLADAQFAMGRLHAADTGTQRDPFACLEYWVQAARQGHTSSLVALGQWLLSESSQVSFSALSRAAVAGDAQAQFLLARQLDQGVGCEVNPSAALDWYEKAARNGHAAAQCSVGAAYLKGHVVRKDVKSALYWLLQAAEQGDARAQWHVGTLYAAGGDGLKRDLKLAFLWFQRSADQGFVAATSNLGILYALTGLPERAVAAWTQAAEHDDPEALYNLALAHIKGDGAEKDDGHGLSLLHRAAELGVIAAQSRLGLMYATGEGAVIDPIESIKWLSLAAEHNDAPAVANLQRCLSLSSPRHVAEGQRRAKAWKSSSLLPSETKLHR